MQTGKPVVESHSEGTVSQVFYLGCCQFMNFMKCGKLSCKNGFPFVDITKNQDLNTNFETRFPQNECKS